MRTQTKAPLLRVATGAALAVVLVATSTGCATPLAPCLEYTPKSMTRIVSLRGYGSVAMTEDSLVCSLRADQQIVGL